MIVGISGLTIEKRFFGLFSRRGNAGAGKDEAAKRLVMEHEFVALAFADPMKRFVRDIYSFSDDQLWGPSELRNRPDTRYPRSAVDATSVKDLVTKITPNFLTPRYALRTLGEEWGRGCYLNTWVDYAMQVAKRLESGNWYYEQKHGLYPCRGKPGKNVVITDLRYRNEADAIRAQGGKLIRVKRLVEKLKLVPNHQSELDLLGTYDDEFDAVLENNGTIEDLWREVDRVILDFSRY